MPKQYPYGITMDRNLNWCFPDFSGKQCYTIISGVLGQCAFQARSSKQVGWVALKCRGKLELASALLSNEAVTMGTLNSEEKQDGNLRCFMLDTALDWRLSGH